MSYNLRLDKVSIDVIIFLAVFLISPSRFAKRVFRPVLTLNYEHFICQTSWEAKVCGMLSTAQEALKETPRDN